MVDSNDIWEDIGTLSEEEPTQVITKLFMMYEVILTREPENSEAQNFFKNLSHAIAQTKECNLDRR